MGGAPIIVTWRGVSADPESAVCWEAAACDPELDDILVRPIPGYGSYRDNAASGGTDNGGGHVDINCVGLTDEQCRRMETVYRRYGNAAYWRPERRPDGTRYGWQNHLHVLRIDTADLSSGARTQCEDYRLGWNGLPIGGRINRDTGNRSYVGARWLTVKTQLAKEADMATLDYISDQLKALGDNQRRYDESNQKRANAIAAKQDALAETLKVILGEVTDIPEDVAQKLKDAVVSVDINFPTPTVDPTPEG